jgi:hypothetical protein
MTARRPPTRFWARGRPEPPPTLAHVHLHFCLWAASPSRSSHSPSFPTFRSPTTVISLTLFMTTRVNMPLLQRLRIAPPQSCANYIFSIPTILPLRSKASNARSSSSPSSPAPPTSALHQQNAYSNAPHEPLSFLPYAKALMTDCNCVITSSRQVHRRAQPAFTAYANAQGRAIISLDAHSEH